MVRFLRAAAIAAIALAGLIACGDERDDPTSGLEPAEILELARGATADTEGFALDLDAKASASTVAGADVSGFAALVAKPIELSAKGRVRRPRSHSLDLDLRTDGLPLQATFAQVEDGLYLTVLGQSFRFATPTGSIAAIEPANIPGALLGWMLGPEDAGRESVDGVQTAHLTGTVDPRALTELASLVGKLSGRPETAVERPSRLRAGALEAWIGTDDLLPRRIRLSMRTDGELRSLPGLASLQIDATLTFSDYGAGEAIVAPPDARTLRVEDLTGLLG